MKSIHQNFTVSFSYEVAFTHGLFEISNPLFAEQVKPLSGKPIPTILFVFDEGMFRHHPDLFKKIVAYAASMDQPFNLVDRPVIIPGGEESKNDPAHVQHILDSIEEADLDRHSYVTVIGGGAVIDTAGYAAAVAHRGIRLVRVPTTVLAQNDAAVGVKNGVNAYGKKNFLGTFVPPHAVLNDFEFLETLDDRDWRSGISEAVKVALIKDASFFEQLERKADALSERDKPVMEQLIHRCAEMHLNHISGSGDPFEAGSSRPLDFGHWAAHKLEQLTNYEVRHGEAVAIGICLDAIYSHRIGLLPKTSLDRILLLFRKCGFQLFFPQLTSYIHQPKKKESILHGLEEFREHLGGELTIMLLEEIGRGTEVHEADLNLYREAVSALRVFEKEPV